MPKLSVWIVRTALLYLGVGMTFGSLMLFNKGVLIDAQIWRLYAPHIEAILIGWTVQLAMGVAFWITPRFRHPPKYGNIKRAWSAFILLNIGILLAIIGNWHGQTWIFAGRSLEALAVIAFVIQIWRRIKPFNAD